MRIQISCNLLKTLVGERGFEPPTPWSRTRKQPFFEIRKNQELEEVENAAVAFCCFGADSSKLKTRRPPPTESPTTYYLIRESSPRSLFPLDTQVLQEITETNFDVRFAV